MVWHFEPKFPRMLLPSLLYKSRERERENEREREREKEDRNQLSFEIRLREAKIKTHKYPRLCKSGNRTYKYLRGLDL